MKSGGKYQPDGMMGNYFCIKTYSDVVNHVKVQMNVKDIVFYRAQLIIKEFVKILAVFLDVGQLFKNFKNILEYYVEIDEMIV